MKFIHKENIVHYVNRCKVFKQRLEKQLWEDLKPLEVTFAPFTGECSFIESKNLQFKPIKLGEQWADKLWLKGWFHLSGNVPDVPEGGRVAMQIDIGGQGLIYDNNGIAIESVTQTSIFNESFKREVHYVDEKSGKKAERWIEAYSMNLFGVSLILPIAPRYGHYSASLNKAYIGIFRVDIWHLMAEIHFLYELYQTLPEGSRRARLIIDYLSKAIDTYGDDASNCSKAREILKHVLKKPAYASTLQLDVIGHAHIDTAWLWPVNVTKYKSVQTFANQIYNINRHKKYCFGASQPQHYEFVRKRQPELFERIKQAVADKRWELQSGMWVESDCNIPSGESLIRQFLQGQRFYREHFGQIVNNTWLPDVFGYNGNLPQIMKHCACPNFLTQKLSWNNLGGSTAFPFYTFRWKGVDGSEVLAHFPPANSYNSTGYPSETINAEYRYNESQICESAIFLVGIGDGGGGPSDEHLKFCDLSENCEGVPRLLYQPANKTFDELKKHWDELPTWEGELYLEAHRGTLTAQAKVKKRNRLLERKILAVEQLLSLASIDEQITMRELWRDLLRNQFHDILPGSSIHQVYIDTHKEYDAIEEKLEQLQIKALSKLGEKETDTLGFYNPAHCTVTKRITLPEDWQAVEGDAVLACRDNFALIQVPAHSSCTLRKSTAKNKIKITYSDDNILENDFVRYIIDKSTGRIVEGYDKRYDRKFITPDNPANLIELFIDQPNRFPAWDIDIFYENMLCDSAKVISYEFIENQPIGCGIKLIIPIGKSKIEQIIFLNTNSPRLDFETKVNWQDRDRILRVRFPFALAPTSHCRADIPYAFNEKVTHRNLPSDRAQFEFLAQRYCDLSEDAFGVALINNCKYGHSVLNNTLGLTLLTGSQSPDPDADLGEHEFTYSIFPHAGWQNGNPVWDEAESCNTQLCQVIDTNLTNLNAPVNLSASGIRLCAWKQHEDNPEITVIRLVEIDGRNNKGKMKCNPKFKKITSCNGIEDIISESMEITGQIDLDFKPFEIRSYLLSK